MSRHTLEKLTRKMTYFSDAGHGWLGVKREALDILKVEDQISGYSYETTSGRTVYLEEDRDMVIFLHALAEYLKMEKVEFSAWLASRIHHSNSARSHVRSKPHFSRLYNGRPVA